VLSLDDLDGKKMKIWPVLRLGFRPFFLLGSLYAVVAMLAWVGVYRGWWMMPFEQLPPMTWHAHEMIYGYALAVVAGFLLTAVKNWTGIQTAYGWRLALLALFWVCARIGALVDTPISQWLLLAGDMAFVFMLCFEIAWPILRARKWEQIGILAKVILLGLSSALFYAGLLGWHEQALYWGLYSGLYLIIGLIITMGRRVIPFFIERGVDSKVELMNLRFIDLAAIPVFLLFYVLEVFTPFQALASIMALVLCLFYLVRLRLWHHPDIWKKPLLWSLYLSQVFITIGLLMLGLRLIVDVPSFLAIHAFAYGGIGLVTLGMMARVSWGHSGRDVFNPPALLNWVFALLFIGAMVRVFLPLVIGHYAILVLIAQVFWIASFGLFLWLYMPVFIKPRIDGRFG
jgi:uncharacterized protein involved in response to NO